MMRRGRVQAWKRVCAKWAGAAYHLCVIKMQWGRWIQNEMAPV